MKSSPGPSDWYALPRDVRKRLRRNRDATVAQAPALAAWAETRWRRAVWLYSTLPLFVVAAASLNLIANTDSTPDRIIRAALALTLLAYGVTSGFLRPATTRRANDLAVILIDSAYATVTTEPGVAAQPMVVRHRLPWRGMLIQLVTVAAVCVALVVAAGAVGSEGLPTDAYVIVGAAAVLTLFNVTTDGSAIVRRLRGPIIADLSHDGIKLSPAGPRLPWHLFTTPTVDVDKRGRFAIELPIKEPADRSAMVLRVDSIRERPLDVLIAVRRFVAA